MCRLTEQGLTSFAAPEPGTTSPKCRECAHPPAEGRRSCPGHLGRESLGEEAEEEGTVASEAEPPQTPPAPNGSAQTTTRCVCPREEADTVVDKPEYRR